LKLRILYLPVQVCSISQVYTKRASVGVAARHPNLLQEEAL